VGMAPTVTEPPTESFCSTTSPRAASSSRRTPRARGRKAFADFGEADGAAETVEEAGAEFVF